jgi:hypothetical protein
MLERGTFSIRVIDNHGYGIRGATVHCQYGHLSGVGKEYTDGDGWAKFPVIHEIFLGGGAIAISKIWVNGEEVSDDTFDPSDGDTLSFTMPD